MAQIFKPSANVIASVSLIGLATVPLAAGLGVAALSRSPANTKVNVPLNQPVPFSHQHHAWELGIDCRYCHTSVEKSGFAGLPASETCMSCHSQIWTNAPLLEPVRQSYATNTPLKWNKVNKVPEFVFFDHSIHVARGVQCNTCHGPVNNMNMTYKGNSFQMAWCLQCHRAPERYLYKDKAAPAGQTPRQQVFRLYWKLQEQGVKGLSPREVDLVSGGDGASDAGGDKTEGRKLINKYGVKVQQLADCWICHR
ncbi:MAG TPA: cytochrome c3 family protein [Fimbriimonas sp.]